MATTNSSIFNTVLIEPASSLSNIPNEQNPLSYKKKSIIPLLDLSKELQFNISKQKLIRNKLCGQICIKCSNFADLGDNSPIVLVHSFKSASVSSRKTSLKRKKSIIKSKKSLNSFAGGKIFHRKPCDKHPTGKTEMISEEKVSCVCLII